MKKNILFLTVIALLFSACKNNDDEEVFPKSARVIKSFLIEGQVGNTSKVYTADSAAITIYVNDDTNITNIAPDILFSDDATISPSVGTPVSFTLNQPFPYTVTSQSGLALKWDVTLKKYIAPEITSFVVPIESRVTITPGKITVDYRAGTDIKAIMPVITVPEGSSISPASGAARDFTTPKTYTVTHQSGFATQAYTVTFIPRG